MTIKKILILSVVVIISLIGGVFLYIIVDDKLAHENEEISMAHKYGKALAITWEASNGVEFWEAYENSLHPLLDDLRQALVVSLVLPFEHKPLKHPGKEGTWTHCAIVQLHDQANSDYVGELILQELQASTFKAYLRTVDLMRIQQNLDMFYPVSNGVKREAKLNATIEYILSQPEHREQYYQDQYNWSGPAMRDLHSRDKAGRFIGYEVEKRLFGDETMPEWDVIHVIGFTTWQEIKAIPFFYSTWNKHAERVWGEGMTFKKKLAEWEEIRVNIKSPAKQNIPLTLTDPSLKE